MKKRLGSLAGCSLLLLVIFQFISCEYRDKSGKSLRETTTSGSITIAADESLMPIVEAEVKAFEDKYKHARIKVLYGSETFAVNKVLYDTCRLAIVSRKFTEEELQILKQKNKLPGKSIRVGIDAVALIVNRENPDSVFTYDQLERIFRGEIKNWKQINPQSSLKDIKIIFDDDSAASVRFMKDSVARTKELPSNCYALDSNPKVLDYVSKEKDAIGLIGVSWVSDRDDTTSLSFLNKIRVVALTKPGSLKRDESFQPLQAYIATGEYPLRREIYILNKEVSVKLGSGLTSYIASDKGQRIILKSGLVPATMPIRLVKINRDPINYE
jgi:phosphate transport system substrate-binding protein